MEWSRLEGAQYVSLAPGVAECIAPYLAVAPWEIDELVVDLARWPDEIRPAPRKGRNGQLIAGDPVLLGASDDGLLLSGSVSTVHGAVLVRWECIHDVQVLRRALQPPSS